ncbi:NAD(+)/NADH kinase [Halorubrum sp. BV1]|uniref:NAD(+)/NADH kinase n=1 Tax=Halorubrum sp. BV1 TaxID=1498500 RepID=UPI0006792F62|nr:NAD(+)/NADH kinase [Halorubrum sp. BV1]
MDASERRITVVGTDDRTAEIRRAVDGVVDRTGDALPTTTATAVSNDAADAAVVVAVGREALRDTVAAAPNGTVIPVGRDRFALDVGRLKDVLSREFSAGPATAEPATPGSNDARDAALAPIDGVRRATHPVLAVDGTSASPRAAFDVAFVTDSPARISEFAIEFAYGTPATFRADGVVVATPLGSGGYANAAGAPIVEPGGGLAVTPIAPFRTQTDSWIAASELTVTVEREEEPVALVVDGAKRTLVDPNRPTAIEAVDRVDLVVATPGSERDDRKHSNNS